MFVAVHRFSGFCPDFVSRNLVVLYRLFSHHSPHLSERRMEATSGLHFGLHGRFSVGVNNGHVGTVDTIGVYKSHPGDLNPGPVHYEVTATMSVRVRRCSRVYVSCMPQRHYVKLVFARVRGCSPVYAFGGLQIGLHDFGLFAPRDRGVFGLTTSRRRGHTRALLLDDLSPYHRAG